MWIMLSDCFLSIVKKDCPEGHLLVRARRPGDIEKVFGRRTKVTTYDKSDYFYRAVVHQDDVVRALQNEVLRIDYGNFKDSVRDDDLHDAYMGVWTAMAATQDPPPYSGWRSSAIVPAYSPTPKQKKRHNKKGAKPVDHAG